MSAWPEIRTETLSNITNRTVWQVKRDSMTTLSTAITAPHCRSPSPKKPFFFLSPDSFQSGGTRYNENLLHSEPNRKKRSREESNLTGNKKSKLHTGPVTKMITELFDPDSQSTMGFRCFRESEIIKDKTIEKKIIKNDCDDDCPTDDLQIEACVEYMSKEIEQTLANYNI